MLYAHPEVLLISSSSHFAVVHRIESSLATLPESEKPNISHFLVDRLYSSFDDADLKKASLIVTFGAEALGSVLKKNTDVPILSILIRRNSFHELQHTYAANREHPLKISAIYLDHPLQRQIHLIQAIFPDIESTSSIGVLFGPNSIQQQEELIALAEKNHLRLNTIYVNNFENPAAVMDSFLDEVKVLLALPDSRIFNPRSARGILLTAYHKKVPLVGYSQSYVKNGALVSLFSTTKQIGLQAAEVIVSTLKNEALPKPQYPRDFSLEINYQVARSLNLTIDSQEVLFDKIYSKELPNKEEYHGT